MLPDPNMEHRRANPTFKDKVLKSYWAHLRSRKDFDYMCRGISRDKENELLIIGDLTMAKVNG
jgi:hypothetical protein